MIVVIAAALRPPDHVTPLADHLLKILRTSGEWMTRTQIAQAIGRSRLTPYDISCLELLATQALVETRQAKRGLFGTRWEYRALTPRKA